MGADITLEKLLSERISVLNTMIINLGKDLETVEQLSQVMDFSNECINDIKKINLEITKLGEIGLYDEKYEKRLAVAIQAQSEMVSKIKNKQIETIKNMEELGKRKDVIDSYVFPKMDSMFVDKEL